MADTINIFIPDLYTAPSESDIKEAKRWVLRRNKNADTVVYLIRSLLEDYSKQITKLAYKYNIKPEQFQFSANKELQEEVFTLMDELQEKILELIEVYSLNVTDDKERKSQLLAWLMALRSKSAQNLTSTLLMRLRQWLYDTEAQIAAMKMASLKQTQAITRIISTMHAVYSTKEMMSAFKKGGSALYLRSRGIHEGNMGLSSSGANNVENLGRQTVIMVWMKSQLLDFKEEGAVGYYQLRGSSYPCTICDDEVGLHIGNFTEDPYPHPHCACYRLPIKLKQQ